jgi:hypothetical protein
MRSVKAFAIVSLSLALPYLTVPWVITQAKTFEALGGTLALMVVAIHLLLRQRSQS